MRNFFSWHWDFVGFGASFICALHCLLIPLIFTLGIFAEMHWLLNSFVEWIFIGISICIANWSLLRTYFYKHQNWRPLLVAGLGIIGLLLAQTLALTNKHQLMAIGGGLVAYAHFYNWHLMHGSKGAEEKTRYWITPGRIITIALIFLYFLGLRSSFMHDNTPPSREKIMEVVWRPQQ